MAQLARDLQAQPDLDYHLEYQLRSWESVPEYAQWWSEMDSTQKEAFHLEWAGITESRLQQLQRWAELGLFSPDQRQRYERLTRLVAQHRPTVEALLRDPT